MQISLTGASAELVNMVEAALQGEEVVIFKDNQPVVRLAPLEPIQEQIQKRCRQPGSAKGLIWISDDFDEPLEDFKEYME
jgi:antitoxin (DNA-binding transcriptional repressor) of toxin-antitoxin stability system